MARRKYNDLTPRRSKSRNIRTTVMVDEFLARRNANEFINSLIENSREYKNFEIEVKLGRIKIENSCSQNSQSCEEVENGRA